MPSSSSTAIDSVTSTKSDSANSNEKAKANASDTKQVWESRAVIKLIEAGSAAECPHCLERVKFRARHRDQQVICNVYESGAWLRVEQYHLECYGEADSPHGEALKP